MTYEIMIQEFGRFCEFYVKCPCMKDSGYVDFVAIMDIFSTDNGTCGHILTHCGSKT